MSSIAAKIAGVNPPDPTPGAASSTTTPPAAEQPGGEPGGQAGSDANEGKTTPPAEQPGGDANANNSNESTGNEQKPGEQSTSPLKDQPATPPASEINDDQVREYLKRKGIEVNSLDDLKKPGGELTDDQKREQAEKRRTEAVAHALANNSITRAELEEYNVAVVKDPKELIYPLFAEKIRSLNPEATDQDIQDAFADQFGELEEEGSLRHKLGQQEMQTLAQNYLNQKYGKIIGLDQQYETFQQNVEAANAYNTQVDNVLASMPAQLSFGVDVELDGKGAKDTKTYNYTPSKETMAEIKEQFQSAKAFAAIRGIQVNDEELRTSIQNAVIAKEWPNIIREVAARHADAMVLAAEAGRKNIPADTGMQGSKDYVPVPQVGRANSIIDGHK